MRRFARWESLRAARVPKRGALRERLRLLPGLTQTKRAGNMHRVSLRCRSASPRKSGKAQDRAITNTPRRLCGVMPPTHTPHPPISLCCAVAAQKRGNFAHFLLKRLSALHKSLAAGRPHASHFCPPDLPEKWWYSSSAAAFPILFRGSTHRVIE